MKKKAILIYLKKEKKIILQSFGGAIINLKYWWWSIFDWLDVQVRFICQFYQDFVYNEFSTNYIEDTYETSLDNQNFQKNTTRVSKWKGNRRNDDTSSNFIGEELILNTRCFEDKAISILWSFIKQGPIMIFLKLSP